MSPVSSIIRIFLAGMEDKSLTYLENQISHNFVGILVLIGSDAASNGNKEILMQSVSKSERGVLRTKELGKEGVQKQSKQAVHGKEEVQYIWAFENTHEIDTSKNGNQKILPKIVSAAVNQCEHGDGTGKPFDLDLAQGLK